MVRTWGICREKVARDSIMSKSDERVPNSPRVFTCDKHLHQRVHIVTVQLMPSLWMGPT